MNGLYTNYEMADSIMVKLNEIEVKGVENMGLIIDCIKQLSALKEGMKKTEDSYKEQIQKMMDRCDELANGKVTHIDLPCVSGQEVRSNVVIRHADGSEDPNKQLPAG